MSPENSHVEGIISSVVVSGDRASKELIKVKCSHKVGP